MEELPGVLWAYCTTIRSPTRETSFSMVYGIEIVIPTEVLIESARVQAYDLIYNDELRRMEVDLVEEKRERAWI